MVFAFYLLAEQAQQAREEPSFLWQMMPFFGLAILFYLMFLRPMQKQDAQRKALIAALKKNDRVVTAGGLIGIVAAVKDKEEEVLLKVDENSNVRLRVTRSSIVRVMSEEPAKEAKEGETK